MEGHAGDALSNSSSWNTCGRFEQGRGGGHKASYKSSQLKIPNCLDPENLNIYDIIMSKHSKSVAASVLVGSDEMSHFVNKVIASVFERGIERGISFYFRNGVNCTAAQNQLWR